MRLIGYPPGWLEEAKLEHSGLNLYNSEGNRELDPAEEAGEIFIPENNVKYDIKKLHDFPGFNIPAPPDTHDVRKRHNDTSSLEDVIIKLNLWPYKCHLIRKKIKKQTNKQKTTNIIFVRVSLVDNRLSGARTSSYSIVRRQC